MEGGAMLVRLYRAGNGADFRLLVIIFSSGSTAVAWYDRVHTGAQYSEVE